MHNVVFTKTDLDALSKYSLMLDTLGLYMVHVCISDIRGSTYWLAKYMNHTRFSAAAITIIRWSGAVLANCLSLFSQSAIIGDIPSGFC